MATMIYVIYTTVLLNSFWTLFLDLKSLVNETREKKKKLDTPKEIFLYVCNVASSIFISFRWTELFDVT